MQGKKVYFMKYVNYYQSPLGNILLAADETGLTGLWFEGQKCFELCYDKNRAEKEAPVLTRTKEWLDIYFSGKEPDFKLPFHFTGTDFQKEVWENRSFQAHGEFYQSLYFDLLLNAALSEILQYVDCDNDD